MVFLYYYLVSYWLTGIYSVAVLCRMIVQRFSKTSELSPQG